MTLLIDYKYCYDSHKIGSDLLSPLPSFQPKTMRGRFAEGILKTGRVPSYILLSSQSIILSPGTTFSFFMVGFSPLSNFILLSLVSCMLKYNHIHILKCTTLLLAPRIFSDFCVQCSFPWESPTWILTQISFHKRDRQRRGGSLSYLALKFSGGKDQKSSK